MHRRTLLVSLALVPFVGLSPRRRCRDDRPFKVTSTLDGKTVLPHRIHWLGYPSLAHAGVAQGRVSDRREARLGRALSAVRLRQRRQRPKRGLSRHELADGRESIVRRPRDREGWNDCNRHSRRSRPPGSRTAGSALGNLGADDRHRRGAEARIGRQPDSTLVASGRWAHRPSRSAGCTIQPRGSSSTRRATRPGPALSSSTTTPPRNANQRRRRGDLPPVERQARRRRLVVLSERTRRRPTTGRSAPTRLRLHPSAAVMHVPFAASLERPMDPSAVTRTSCVLPRLPDRGGSDKPC